MTMPDQALSKRENNSFKTMELTTSILILTLFYSIRSNICLIKQLNHKIFNYAFAYFSLFQKSTSLFLLKLSEPLHPITCSCFHYDNFFIQLFLPYSNIFPHLNQKPNIYQLTAVDKSNKQNWQLLVKIYYGKHFKLFTCTYIPLLYSQ